MAYFDELLQRAITVRNNRAPASNTADLVGGVLVGIVTALQMLLDDKQDELTFDTAPTADSQNPVTSDGIYQALQAIDLSACEKIVNKVTSINAQSTDVQYPSAKLLYDQLQGLAAVYAPKVHTHPFADIIRPANVASVNAQGYTITTAYYSHVLTITADATLHLPTMQGGAAVILRLTIIQDATGGRAVTFDGGAALVFNPYQTDLSLGQANYRCWVVLWFDGVNWAWLASPYVLRAESQFAYTIDGTTGGQYVTVTINGTTMQIQATSGVWQYGYNNPINSIAFTGDTGVLNVDFTNSDGLANITTLADAFKNCAALVAVDFTGCDLSNVATAADCFAGCTSLAALTIPTGTWKPDIDLSACAAFTKAAMLAVIDGLYTYASGTHTVTFNSTVWDALSQADQQAVFDAAAAKGWTTNAVAFVYYIRGKSTATSETFIVTFIDDVTQSIAQELITCAVDAQGIWEYEYRRKKLYALDNTWRYTTTITEIEITEECDKLVRATQLYTNNGAYSSVTKISFPNARFDNLVNAQGMFGTDQSRPIATSINIPQATFASLQNANAMFQGIAADFTLNQTFGEVTDASYMFRGCGNVSMPNATFAAATNTNSMFANCSGSISLPLATFANVTTASYMFQNSTTTSVSLPLATFASVTNAQLMFNVMPNLQTLSLPNATFASCTNGYGMFAQFNTAAMRTISMPNATLGALLASGNNPNLFGGLTVSQSITALEFAQNGLNTSLQVPCNLNYANMLNVANWLADRTGLSASTITFRTAVWNALSAAEQSNIDAILQAKNWTRLISN